ncbi:hypothetical protein FOC52_13995 (plasmid) [Staphylococcus cohnii]|nr:hypothetical protein FOC52_13510 [Staphylococcus cohnii]QKU19860.1 hypothetical protein FOC52_13750 [Staphylococcus cohnii]QKU19908.1 hypothetical protein FOC52_13995 [Staphylococcus cohnii]
MVILATITFRPEEKEISGILEYGTGDIVGEKFMLLVYENNAIDNRYKLKYKHKTINLNEYVHETDLIRIERMYERAKENRHLTCFTTFIHNWDLASA